MTEEKLKIAGNSLVTDDSDEKTKPRPAFVTEKLADSFLSSFVGPNADYLFYR